MDATFGSAEAVERAAEEWTKKSPLKGNYRRVEGTLTHALNDSVTIRTPEGREQSYVVDPTVRGKLKEIRAGAPVTLFLDAEQKILDVSTPRHTGN